MSLRRADPSIFAVSPVSFFKLPQCSPMRSLPRAEASVPAPEGASTGCAAASGRLAYRLIRRVSFVLQWQSDARPEPQGVRPWNFPFSMRRDMTGSPLGPADAEDIMFSPDEEIAAYRVMLLIRRFEEKVGQLYALQAIHGACPLCIGQEAAIVGMMLASRPTDPVITGYRTHGALLARGVDPKLVMAELLGRRTGLSGGKGGTVRMFAPEFHFYGGHGSAGLAAPLGTGLALAAKNRGEGAVALCFFGDGAAQRGRVAEAYRAAARWSLPIVFVVDNNTAAPGASIVLGAVPSALSESGAPFAIPGEQVDGIDVRRTRAAGLRAIERARRGDGPTILEMLTYRYRGHGAMPARGGLGERRIDDADPIMKARSRILASSLLSERALKALEKEVRERVTAAATAARAEPVPSADDLLISAEAT
jgi:pyruvate dehydrogenase E1 component alpha subunit